jgi:lysophospholipase L1-like esterase
MDTSFVVMAIGDSFTEGFGTPSDSTWINLLADRLKEDIPNILPVNAGIAGSDVIFESYKLRYLLYDIYQPDLVILTINESDIQDIIVRGGKERFISAQELQYNSGPPWKYLYSFSHVFRLFIHQVLRIRWHFYTDKGYEVAFQKTKDIMLKSITEDLLPFSEEKKFDLLVVFTPLEFDLRNKVFLLSELYDELVKIDSSLTLNMYEAFLKTGEDDYQQYYWPIDLHCNSKGYLKWAEEMEKHLKTTDKSYYF